MKYDHTALVERDVPLAGTTIKATVTEINEGKLSEFVTAQIIESKFTKAHPDDNFIQIVVKGEKGESATKLLSLPKDNQVSPSSNFAEWKKAYRGYPSVGQTVFLVANDKGFWRTAI